MYLPTLLSSFLRDLSSPSVADCTPHRHIVSLLSRVHVSLGVYYLVTVFSRSLQDPITQRVAKAILQIPCLIVSYFSLQNPIEHSHSILGGRDLYHTEWEIQNRVRRHQLPGHICPNDGILNVDFKFGGPLQFVAILEALSG